MKIKIKKIETFTITHSTSEFIFDMDEFRDCTPAFIGKTHKDFMDYITTIDDIEQLTGLEFFPELSVVKQRNLESKKRGFDLEEIE